MYKSLSGTVMYTTVHKKGWWGMFVTKTRRESKDIGGWDQCWNVVCLKVNRENICNFAIQGDSIIFLRYIS